MKCFSRYLPYLFRPPSTILSSTCHTEAKESSKSGSFELDRSGDTGAMQRVQELHNILGCRRGSTDIHSCRGWERLAHPQKSSALRRSHSLLEGKAFRFCGISHGVSAVVWLCQS
ncbi:hypothetical protein AOLI_G00060210 [Acnodon oligacanthus]